MAQGVAFSLHAFILEAGFAPFFSTYDGKEDHLYYDRILNGGMEWYLEDRLKFQDHRLIKTGRTADILTEQVVCVTVIGPESPLKDLTATLARHLGAEVEMHCVPHLYSDGWFWLTIHDRRATKDQAIRNLQQYCGLEKSELVVFGDHDNDLKMFKIADRRIAVENATKELIWISDSVIGPNTEDSVALFLQKEWAAKH